MVDENGVEVVRKVANGNGRGRPKATKEQVVQAIKGSAGIKVVIAERLKMTRQSLENYIKRFPELADPISAEREQALDMAELLVLTNIQIQRQQQQATGEVADTTDAWKLLDKMGWKRGYVSAGNPYAINAAKDAVAGGGKVTIREVVVEMPDSEQLTPPQPILGEGSVIVDVEEEDDGEESD